MLVYIAILTPVLLLFCGLVVDVGQLEVRRLQMQSASDAAALGAAQELERGVGNWQSYGKSEASTNGFTDGSSTTSVVINQQPNYGGYTGFYDAVQSTISQQVPLLFLSLLGKAISTVSAQSTAIVAPCAFVSGAAGLTRYALTIASSSTVNATCPWYINSSASMDSGSAFTALAENLSGASGNSSWTVGTGSSPRYSVRPLSDPLAAIIQPSAGSCTATNESISGDVSLTPGTYCGSFKADCHANQQNNQRQCILYTQPGLYVFTGNVSLNYAVFYGNNGTLFFTRNGDRSANSGNVSLTNYSAVFMTAPVNTGGGGVPGVVMMNDRNWLHTNAQDFSFVTSYLYAEGIVYLTGTGLSTSGSYISDQNRFLAFDVDNLNITGSYFNVKSDFSSLPGGSPFQPQGGLVQ